MNKPRDKLPNWWLEQNPCYQCDKRFVGCHDRCKLYQKSKAIKDKIKEKKRQLSIIYAEDSKFISKLYKKHY